MTTIKDKYLLTAITWSPILAVMCSLSGQILRALFTKHYLTVTKSVNTDCWYEYRIIYSPFVTVSRYAAYLRRFAFAAALIKPTSTWSRRATARLGSATRSRRLSGIFQCCCCCYAGYTTRLWQRMFARHSYAINSNILHVRTFTFLLSLSFVVVESASALTEKRPKASCVS